MVLPGNMLEQGPHLHQTGNMDRESWLLNCILPPRMTCAVSKWVLGSVIPYETVQNVRYTAVTDTVFAKRGTN